MKAILLSTLLSVCIILSGFAQTDSTEVKVDSTKTEKKEKKDLPLEAERKIHLSTDNGTWLSLDVSPDGKTIAFDMLGDLYLLPITGGTAERITEDLAFDTHPKFSPDGRSLLFVSDKGGTEEAWIMDLATKESEQITKGNSHYMQSAEWTPDGDYIVVSKGQRDYKLYLYHKDGGSGTQLIKKPDNFKTVEQAFGNDGRYIWFSNRSNAWQYNAQFPQYQISFYDRETGLVSRETGRYGSAFTPTLSPDGKWLVYGTRYNDKTGLRARDLKTGDEKWLAYPVQRDEQESIAPLGVLPAMSFTSDSKNLIASYGGKFYSLPIDGGNAVNIPFKVDVDINLGPRLKFDYPISDDETMTVTQIRDPKVSPDGKRVAFTALDRLYIMDLPDGKPKRVTNFDITEAMPAWSPDGSQIAFVTWDDSEGGHVYKVSASGKGKPVKLTTESAVYTEPAWSYTQDRIAFMRGTKQNQKEEEGPYNGFMQEDLMWIPSNGGALQFIEHSKSRSNPHFVKDVDRIYLYGTEGLISVRWDGTDEKSIIKITGITTYGTIRDAHDLNHLDDNASDRAKKPYVADLILMAPEGDQAMAKIYNEIYTVTVPYHGGETITISVANAASAAFPAKKLTEIGGEFPSWGSKSNTVYWSLGNAFFSYDLAAAKAKEDELEQKKKDEEKKKKEAKEEDKKEDEKKADDEGKKEDEGYKANEFRIKVEATRDIPKGTVLLKNARIITMNSDEVIENGDILIENNRIKQVGSTGSISVASNVKIMDMSGKTITPGFVDTHAHMWPAWFLHKNEAWVYAANLAYGVTTTRDPQTATTDVLTYADMVESGQIYGPRVYSTGPGVGYWGYNVKSLEQAKSIIKQYSEYYNTKTIKMYLTGNRQQRQWIVMACKEQEIMPTTEGGLDFKLDMTHILDGYSGTEHNYPIYPLYNDFLKVLSESKTANTPTLLVSYGGPWAENYYYATEDVQGDKKLNFYTPKSELDAKSRRRNAGWFMKEEYVFDDHAKFINELVKAGGLAGVGSHGQLQGLGYHWELWSVQSGGMSELNALKVATILGAEAIGLEKDLGSIEPGKLADLVILDENPLENIRNSNTVNMVMKNGRLYKAESLDEIYPLEKKAPKFEWHQAVPVNIPGIK